MAIAIASSDQHELVTHQQTEQHVLGDSGRLIHLVLRRAASAVGALHTSMCLKMQVTTLGKYIHSSHREGCCPACSPSSPTSRALLLCRNNKLANSPHDYDGTQEARAMVSAKDTAASSAGIAMHRSLS